MFEVSELKVRRLTTSASEFDAQFTDLLSWEAESERHVESQVADIISKVRSEGDSALVRLTEQYDRNVVSTVQELIVSSEILKEAYDGLSEQLRNALNESAARIEQYHRHQLADSWSYHENDITLGQQVRPLSSAGIYVPGGLASYPSSVLMNAIPAKVAGVKRIVMVSPTPDGKRNSLVLAAAHLAGVDLFVAIGGAQAVAALAYGTESIEPVDKIVGPGNIYVATAKKQVFGKVGIDMIAGPSEIMIYCDGRTNPDWIAMDLFSQAEHDVKAQAILLSDDEQFLNEVEASIHKLLPTMPRKEIICQSLHDRGALIKVSSTEDAVQLINKAAPEHLELSVDSPESLLPEIHHAGAIFMGRYTAEALGDYCAGPNHVLPTSGTSRFSSPLGVYDFQKRSSVIYAGADAAARLGKVAALLADGEGLPAHAASARYRT